MSADNITSVNRHDLRSHEICIGRSPLTIDPLKHALLNTSLPTYILQNKAPSCLFV